MRICFSSEVMEFVCDVGKNNACQQNTCLCDVELANQILAYLEDWDPFHSNNKGFDPSFSTNNDFVSIPIYI